MKSIFYLILKIFYTEKRRNFYETIPKLKKKHYEAHKLLLQFVWISVCLNKAMTFCWNHGPIFYTGIFILEQENWKNKWLVLPYRPNLTLKKNRCCLTSFQKFWSFLNPNTQNFQVWHPQRNLVFGMGGKKFGVYFTRDFYLLYAKKCTLSPTLAGHKRLFQRFWLSKIFKTI